MSDSPAVSLPSPPPLTQGQAFAHTKMPFLEHLGELRRRLIYTCIVWVAASGSCFAFSADIFRVLCRPLQGLQTAKMIVLTPMEMFLTYIKLALYGGLFVAMPFVLSQLWLFLAPGLYAHEKRWLAPFVLCSWGCFLGGAAFCFYLVLPASFHYLVDMVPQGVEAHYSVSAYLGLLIQLMLAFGLVFELPLVMTLLSAARLVHPTTFAKWRKYWLIVATFLGGILTPTPDPLTQMMMAVPLVVFYEFGVVGARWVRAVRGAGR
jgi:sec-independent protein translocase protein TatC